MQFVDTRLKGRLASSSACRHWYSLRQEARKNGLNPPLWVITSPPWPVLKLALKMAGKPALLGFFLFPLGLLAGAGDEVIEPAHQDTNGVLDDRQDQGLGAKIASALSWQGFFHRFRLSGAD